MQNVPSALNYLRRLPGRAVSAFAVLVLLFSIIGVGASSLSSVAASPADNSGKQATGPAPAPPPSTPTFKTGAPVASGDTCGAGDTAVKTTINFGCKHKGNGILDMTFAIIRVLSDGVGLVIIGSLIVGGIQYSASRDDPQSVAMATNRIRSTIFALFIFIFGYAFLNYIIPAGVLK